MKFERRNGLMVPRSTCDVVIVEAFNALGGGTAPFTTFTDTFNRSSGSLGKQWVQGIVDNIPLVPPIPWQHFAIATANDLVTQSLTITASGQANPNSTPLISYAAPVPAILPCWGLTQFSQVQINDINNWSTAACQFYLVVGMQPSAQIVGYALVWTPNTPNLQLVRIAFGVGNAPPGSNLGVITTLVNNINGNVYTLGTPMRISMDYTVPAAPVIRVSLNNVLITTFTDNVSPLPAAGCPGMFAINTFTVTPPTLHATPYSCGLGI